MRRRRLGTTDLEISVLGLGTWAIGGGDWKAGWGPQDDADSIATIHAALESGIDWIDTAAVYGAGRSEAVVGRALATWSGSRPLVATKCGRRVDAQGGVFGDLSPEGIRQECEDSLRRLGLEAIDLYQIHWPKPDEELERAWQTLVELKQAGKVRHIGVSNCDVDQLRRLQAIHPVASLQPPCSLLRRGVEAELLPFCREQGIGVICYSPMGKGLLTGRWDEERIRQLPESDHRSRDPDFQQPRFGIHQELVDKLEGIADEAGYSPAHLALAWVLQHEAVTAAIVGARRPEQIRDTARAGDWELDEERAAVIDAYLEEHEEALQEWED